MLEWCHECFIGDLYKATEFVHYLLSVLLIHLMMRKRKSSEPIEEEKSAGDRRAGKAQVIRLVQLSYIAWLCLGLVIGQLLCYFSYWNVLVRMYLWGTMDHVTRGEVVRIQVRGSWLWFRNCISSLEGGITWTAVFWRLRMTVAVTGWISAGEPNQDGWWLAVSY